MEATDCKDCKKAAVMQQCSAVDRHRRPGPNSTHCLDFLLGRVFWRCRRRSSLVGAAAVAGRCRRRIARSFFVDGYY
jgi:hypothetical protein